MSDQHNLHLKAHLMVLLGQILSSLTIPAAAAAIVIRMSVMQLPSLEIVTRGVIGVSLTHTHMHTLLYIYNQAIV